MPPAPDPEPRREDCPWCGSQHLRTRLRAPGLLRGRPGTFVVDECEDCAHAFQNPRLRAEGLAAHHGDFREAAPLAERVLAARRRRGHLRSAARAMLAFPEPESWLDVGTGDAHLPQTAKELFPYTSFDAVASTPRVTQAQASGHIEEAHIGHLAAPEVTARLRGRYDVVSMLHHLEHAPDPREELRAALTVLRPGGHLLLELADPHCAFAQLLGPWWASHTQPHHLHLIPLPNLRAELESQGCTITATDRRAAHNPRDLTTALALAVTRPGRHTDTPSHVAPPTAGRRALHTILLHAATPGIATAAALDHALSPLLRRTRFSNAYRVIARKN